jgi:hypothetical protein
MLKEEVLVLLLWLTSQKLMGYCAKLYVSVSFNFLDVHIHVDQCFTVV